jgi:DNA-binding CsgD family transcriptional regulator
VELPAALEDLAVVLAERGPEDEARAALNRPSASTTACRPPWDIRRAEARLGSRASGAACAAGTAIACSGREALTLTEVKIAALVARGDSASDIARGMFVSRRTVQACISRILTKLGAKSRAEIVGEALRRASRPSVTAGRCIAAKVSSYDHYSRPRLAGSIEECPAPGTAKPRDGHSM